jgi:hypothetical protein
MSNKAKKVIGICLLAMLVFGFISHILSKYQQEGKKEMVAFIKYDCLFEGAILDESGVITLEAMSVINKDFGDWRDQKKRELWDKYRYYDYWLSVSKTLAFIALFIVIFTVVRAILSKVYISENIYGKFKQIDRKEEDEEK